MYCDEYARTFGEVVQSSSSLAGYLDGVTLADYDKTTRLQKQLHQVARLIKTRVARKAERDFFYVQIGGFDTHQGQASQLHDRLLEIDGALAGFVPELQAQGVFDSTVIVTESDFGRTLTYNGEGTDHGWAGNHFVIGGGIHGGRVYNKFPETLSEGGPFDAGRGRMIPEYPWESMLAPIAEWVGVEPRTVFPNIGNFNSTHIIDRSKLFKH